MELPGALTPFDTPEIIAARAAQDALSPTHSIRTSARRALRDRWVRELYGTGASRKARRADIVLGPPGSGKSSALVGPLSLSLGSLVIDADEAKLLIPEYDGGRMAGRVHQESSDLADRLVEMAALEGDNVVLPLVGRNDLKMSALVAALRRASYDVYLHLMDLSPEQAASRAVSRFQDTGRFVDPAYVLTVGTSPAETYTRLKEGGALNGYSRWSNDVPKGEVPRLIEVDREGTLPEDLSAGEQGRS